MKPNPRLAPRLVAFALLLLLALPLAAADKKIVLLAGHASHGSGQHEFRAGCLLLKKCLDQVPGINAVVIESGWPADESVFNGADAVFIYSDGGGSHFAIKPERLAVLDALVKKGVGLGCAHYAVEVPKDHGGPEWLAWTGGYFETFWSVNPHWDADFKSFPSHPITRGVQPFKITDEWYYHMRFPDGMKGVTPLLTAVPPDSTRGKPGKSDAHGGNPEVQKHAGEPEHVMWCMDRPDGGRGFGFTGGHFHKNWAEENFRRVVLNAMLWIAKVEVPAGGVQTKLSDDDLKANLDKKDAPASTAKPAAPAPKFTAAPKFKSGIVTAKTGNPTKVDVDLTGAKDLFLVVSDGGDGIGCDWADWVNPELTRADGSKVKLTELKWESAVASHGQVRVNRNNANQPLRIAGRPYENGFGTHAKSVIHFELPGAKFARFTALAGLDNGGTDQGCGSTVEFLVFTEAPSPTAIAAVAAIATGAEGRAGPAAAKAFMSTMTAAAGLEATLFASEPMLVNPADMDVDAHGRVWITEGANYRKWSTLRPEGDRVVILEDTNCDGVADKSTTFYQDPSINTALGICVLGNKAIVSCAPNVFLLTDTKGTGVADKRELLFTGIEGHQHDHAIHTFTFGPDGKLYFNFGNAGRHLRRPTGKLKDIPLHGEISAEDIKANSEPVIDLAGNEVSDAGKPYRDGMVFRCNLDGSEVETLGWNFRNNYEVAVDSFGTLWQSDNDDDGNKGVRINYVMEFGNYGYKDEMTGAAWKADRTGIEEEIPRRHWHLNDPGVVPNLLQTGAGSPTGILVYEGKLLPKIFQGQVIHCDAGPRVVRAYPVKRDGVGYSAEIVDVLTSSDTWYRPSDVCVAPDGSLYIADWNDAGVGGHNMADRELGNMTGRVYRVAPKGNKPALPKLDLNSAKGCVEALQSPNLARRYLAWTKLHEMQGAAEKELLKVWNGSEPRMRARALQLLARIKGGEKKYVEAALKDKDEDLRVTGLRIARSLKLDVIPLVKQLAKDSSAAVRRECAIALRHNKSSEAPKLWAALAQQHDGKDRWYVEALGIAADQQDDAFFAAWLSAVGGNWNTPAGRDIVWRSRSKQTPALLAKIINDKSTTEKEKPRYLRALDFHTGPEKDAALVELLTGGTK
ncbi:MAG: NPCBM/NEW2 domain-containing protein [Verrucomicrobia bacterium]|nr:NPCBM/NEW2 domain-containing protein [Verrucomicrobiota bacterium]